MKGKVVPCQKSHGFVSIAPLQQHYEIYDAATFAQAEIVPEVACKIHFHTGVMVFPIRCVVKGITAVFPDGLYATAMKIVRYGYVLDVL